MNEPADDKLSQPGPGRLVHALLPVRPDSKAAADTARQFAAAQRFGQKVDGTRLNGVPYGAFTGMAGDEDYRQIRLSRQQRLPNLQAAGVGKGFTRGERPYRQPCHAHTYGASAR